jgi:hypothetical protein
VTSAREAVSKEIKVVCDSVQRYPNHEAIVSFTQHVCPTLHCRGRYKRLDTDRPEAEIPTTALFILIVYFRHRIKM